MGCGSSANINGSVASDLDDEKNSYNRRPDVSFQIGEKVKRLATQPCIVLIFGGPGSRKGRIVDDLVNVYGFNLLSIEELIHKDLPLKLSNSVKLTNILDIKEVIENQPSNISTEYVFSLVRRSIEQSSTPTGMFVVDVVPNKKYMLKLPLFTSDATQELEKFEEQYKISFALDLARSDAGINRKDQGSNDSTVIKTNGTELEKRNNANNVANKATKQGNETPGMKETGGKGDEADVGRTTKRAALYAEMSRQFTTYFSRGGRLLTVDADTGLSDNIWNKIHNLLTEMTFSSVRAVNTLILFTFDNDDICDINLKLYAMEYVMLKNIVDNPEDSIDVLLEKLSNHLNAHAGRNDAFVVDLIGTSITKTTAAKIRSLVFDIEEEGCLEEYLPGSPANYTPASNSKRYRVLSSSENEMCLFTKNTPIDICTTIASKLALVRTIK